MSPPVSFAVQADLLATIESMQEDLKHQELPEAGMNAHEHVRLSNLGMEEQSAAGTGKWDAARVVVGALLALGFPDRVGQLQKGKENTFSLSNGRLAAFPAAKVCEGLGFRV
jgi:hypothetical protein